MEETLRHLRTGLGTLVAILAFGAGPAGAWPGEFEMADLPHPAPPDTIQVPAHRLVRDIIGVRPRDFRVPEPESRPGLLAPDRLQHASLSFSLGLGLGLVTEEPAAAAGGAIVLGLVKEMLDPRFDRGDFAADLLGAALAALLTSAL